MTKEKEQLKEEDVKKVTGGDEIEMKHDWFCEKSKIDHKTNLEENLLNSVNGGVVIKNADDRTEEELEKEELERELNILKEIVASRTASFQETMELMKKIADLQRQIENCDEKNIIIKNR